MSYLPVLIVPRYNHKDPATFLPGDIVEVQASFACFPARNGKSTLGIVMRGLTLLDDSLSKVRSFPLEKHVHNTK